MRESSDIMDPSISRIEVILNYEDNGLIGLDGRLSDYNAQDIASAIFGFDRKYFGKVVFSQRGDSYILVHPKGRFSSLIDRHIGELQPWMVYREPLHDEVSSAVVRHKKSMLVKVRAADWNFRKVCIENFLEDFEAALSDLEQTEMLAGTELGASVIRRLESLIRNVYDAEQIQRIPLIDIKQAAIKALKERQYVTRPRDSRLGDLAVLYAFDGIQEPDFMKQLYIIGRRIG